MVNEQEPGKAIAGQAHTPPFPTTSWEDVYRAWFNHIQTMHLSNPDRHQNQENYDKTLYENYKWVFANLPQVETKAVLYDIGCAYGSMSLGAYALGYNVFAFDITDKYVNLRALTARQIEFSICNIELNRPSKTDKTELERPKADVVVFTEVLEHLCSNPVVTMQNIFDSMKPGGKLILSTPRKECGRHEEGTRQVAHWRDIPFIEDEKEYDAAWEDAHTYIFTEPELRELLDYTGFHLVGTGQPWGGLTQAVVAYRRGDYTPVRP